MAKADCGESRRPTIATVRAETAAMACRKAIRGWLAAGSRGVHCVPQLRTSIDRFPVDEGRGQGGKARFGRIAENGVAGLDEMRSMRQESSMCLTTVASEDMYRLERLGNHSLTC